jgi:hypothetical protein
MFDYGVVMKETCEIVMFDYGVAMRETITISQVSLIATP